MTDIAVSTEKLSNAQHDVTYLPPVSELLAWADNPANSGYVPVHTATLRAIAAALTAERQRAEGLRGYALHKSNCRVFNTADNACSCGLAALAASPLSD